MDDEIIDGFVVRRVGTTGHEVLDPDGTVVAWATDEPWALVIAALLNRIEAEGLSSISESSTRATVRILEKRHIHNEIRAGSNHQFHARGQLHSVG